MSGGSFPRLVLGASSSGAGKTTIACGLMAAFRRRGLRVQPFKTGPDYIDPGFHGAATGRPGRNLDTRLMPRGTVLELFRRASADADLSIVEGVMGLYDGAGALDERGSTAHLAKVLRAPVIILLDVTAAARSAAALAWGFARFDRRLRTAGFILNRVGGPSHSALVKTAVEKATGLPVFGGLPRDESLRLPERSMGLIPVWETGGSGKDPLALDEYFSLLADLVEAAVDLDALLEAARGAPEPPPGGGRVFGGPPLPRGGEPPHTPEAGPIPAPKGPAPGQRPRRPREEGPLSPPKGGTTAPRTPGPLKDGPVIALALDAAFHFYYQDNLDILERFGARVLPFSPLEDRGLPPGTAGLYIGGGSPELHAPGLAENQAMLRAVREAVRGGMPVLAEGGGLAYLARSLQTPRGDIFAMAGVLPARVAAEERLRALGYHDGKLLRDCPLGRKGESCPGHLFHRFRIQGTSGEGEVGGPISGGPPGPAALHALGDEESPLFELTRPGREPQRDGFALGSLAAGSLHLHFASRPAWARNFVQACRRYGTRNGGQRKKEPQ